MRERPIIFSGEMVRAILDGRKTMTRRVVKVNHIDITGLASPEEWDDRRANSKMPTFDKWGPSRGFHLLRSHNSVFALRCPYGIPGDRIYVKEKWAQDDFGEVFYGADHDVKPSTIEKWRPSLFMPRLAARIRLGIVNVRVERLQEISEMDAIAEGVESTLRVGHDRWFTYQRGFQELWDSINGKKYPWASNPWVWIIEFELTTVP